MLINIDTATETASVSISLDGNSIACLANNNQKDHASFVHSAIGKILEVSGIGLKDIDAFAVSCGPGSYTGLRVGLAAAKGFCYALSKPLITVSTLEVMTRAVLDDNIDIEKNDLLCPMIDARRMEVYTAMYNVGMEEVFSPQAVVLEKGNFPPFTGPARIIFFGNGSFKFRRLYDKPGFIFSDVRHSAKHLAKLGEIAWKHGKFADVSYSQPLYLKEFHSIAH